MGAVRHIRGVHRGRLFDVVLQGSSATTSWVGVSAIREWGQGCLASRDQSSQQLRAAGAKGAYGHTEISDCPIPL
eukprot:14909377-Heterocapsa_arctica.AAC.1